MSKITTLSQSREGKDNSAGEERHMVHSKKKILPLLPQRGTSIIMHVLVEHAHMKKVFSKIKVINIMSNASVKEGHFGDAALKAILAHQRHYKVWCTPGWPKNS